jgi:hypothetical protein
LTLGLLTPQAIPESPQLPPQKVPKLEEKSPHPYICHCDKPAREWLCQQSEKNPDKIGKHFYKCEAGECRFWAWEGDTVQSNWKKCNCGLPALFLTVKHGKPWNVGRKFYVCPNDNKEGEVGCTFWVWEDGTLPFSDDDGDSDEDGENEDSEDDSDEDDYGDDDEEDDEESDSDELD